MKTVLTESRVRRLTHAFDLLRELVSRDLKLRYKRSVLGIGWSLFNPLLQLVVLVFVFQYLLMVSMPDFTSFLFSGIVVWGWFTASLYAATGAIVDNPTLIRQPGFPTALLPVVTVMSNMVNFAFAMVAVLISLWVTQHPLNGSLIALPLVILVQFLFTLSLSYFLAMLHVPFRDTQYLLGILLMLGFYIVPIFYDSAAIPAQYQRIYHLNPLVGILEAYRTILLHGQVPELKPLITALGLSCVLLVVGCTWFVRVSYSFIEEL
ncbi:MAG: ABC transporter permease [Acidobacteriaceae bacterium]|nr:ABC transporter permease [Acidobacteriaceae bacterium]